MSRIPNTARNKSSSKQNWLNVVCTYELEELLAESALVDALLGVELHDELLLEVLRVLHDHDLQLNQRVLHNVIATHLDYDIMKREKCQILKNVRFRQM